MNHPARDTTAGRAHLDLRRRARAEGRGMNELPILYVLERFLYRLSISLYRERFVLKGGMRLAAFDGRRPTRDVDLLGLGITNDAESAGAVRSPAFPVRVRQRRAARHLARGTTAEGPCCLPTAVPRPGSWVPSWVP